MKVTATAQPTPAFPPITLIIELSTQEEFDTWYQIGNHSTKVQVRLMTVDEPALKEEKVDHALSAVWSALSKYK
jgi:hypothetical protein